MKICIKRHSITQILCFFSIFGYARTDDCEKIYTACVENIVRNGQTSLTGIASYFLGKPYKSGTLEINNVETLVVNLSEFDCVTFVESVMAVYLTLKTGEHNFSDFKSKLKKIRYRNGKIDGYLSRLHYSSDWITDNRKKKILQPANKNNTGEKIFFKPDFMSKNPEKYPYLKSHPQTISQIRTIESEIGKTPFYYIPKSRINALKDSIKDGGIVFFVTSKPGLDISHLGIACRTKSGVLSFIHASQKAGKVILNPESLADYCLKMKSNRGIMVCFVN